MILDELIKYLMSYKNDPFLDAILFLEEDNGGYFVEIFHNFLSYPPSDSSIQFIHMQLLFDDI